MTFLEQAISEIDLNSANSDLNCFILPNKKSSLALKKVIQQKIENPVFAPSIESIDSFMKKISGLQEIEIELSEYSFFKCFNKNNKQTNSNLDYNVKTAISFLNDCSELEQNLLNVNNVFDNLIELNQVKLWGEEDKNKLNQIELIKQLKKSYSLFKNNLLDNEKGTKGICYREAVNNIHYFKEANKEKSFFFIGLNALSKSEEIVIQELLEQNNSSVFWDIDKEFFKNKNHSASHFIRKHRNDWKYYRKNKFKFESTSFNSKKTIQIIESNGFISQARDAGRVLSKLKITKRSNIALVLADEKLLYPLLQFIPKEIEDSNINTTIPVKETSVKQLVKLIVDFKINNKGRTSIRILNRILSSTLLVKVLGHSIGRLDSGYINSSKLKLVVKKDKTLNSLVFEKWDKSTLFLNNLEAVLNKIITSNKVSKIELNEAEAILQKIVQIRELYRKDKVSLNRLKETIFLFIDKLQTKFEHNKNAKITISGLLETRALDYETVIITSVNEGVMPQGKSYTSLLPIEIRLKNGLYGIGEKDKIYSYHFYRLLQRAKDIYLIYNSSTEGVNRGEKSRFIYQLEMNKQKLHELTYENTSEIIKNKNKNTEFLKSPGTIIRLREIAKKGFSPSSLETYIKSPVDYYRQKLLKIEEKEIDKEHASHRIIGLIFHESLENLYKKYVGKKLNVNDLTTTLSKTRDVLKNIFKKHEEPHNQGKNKIIFEVIKSSIETFIRNEIEELKRGSVIKILGLETKVKTPLKLGSKEKVFLTGVIDRVDEKNGTTRIIDYKTGSIVSSQLSVKELSLICKDPGKSKAMQLMCYSWMYMTNNNLDEVLTGIVSFRSLNKGFMNLKIKGSENNQLIKKEHVVCFEDHLKNLIHEIMDPEISFKERNS